jgi:hypothetical protein
MTKGEVFAKFKQLSPEERRAFDRWLQGCLVVGSILSIGLVAMAVAGLRAPGSKTAPEQGWTLSVQEQHGLAHLENLPVQQVEDLTFVFAVDPRPRVPPTASLSDSSAKR